MPLITPTVVATPGNPVSCSAVARKPPIAQDSESEEEYLPQNSGRHLGRAGTSEYYDRKPASRPAQAQKTKRRRKPPIAQDSESEEERLPQNSGRHLGRVGTSEYDDRKPASRPARKTKRRPESSPRVRPVASENDRKPAARPVLEAASSQSAQQHTDSIPTSTTRPTRMNTNEEDVEEEHNVLAIAEWLMNDVIWYHHHKNSEATDYARYYARRIIEFGAHSVQMITDCVKPNDVEGFTWMKPPHRQRLMERLSEK
jgi:hypothetical protein